MFQKLGFINSILGDPAKRKVYDETGDLGVASEELDGDALKMWKEYFDQVFTPVTEDEVSSFAKKYRNSDEETEDIKNAYLSGKGSMDTIMSNVPLAECSEEDRYRAIVETLFESNDLEPTPKWTKTNTKEAILKRKKAEKAEAAAFEKAQKAEKKKARGREEPLDDLEALRAAIIERKKGGFDDLISKLAGKYEAQDSGADPKPKKPKAKGSKAKKK